MFFCIILWAALLGIKHQVSHYVCVNFGDSHVNKQLLKDAIHKEYSKIEASRKDELNWSLGDHTNHTV